MDNNKYYYDGDAAEKLIRWIEKYCTHVKGHLGGKSLILEEWQKADIIRPIFGAKRKSNGLRRYREVYLEIPRKNAKSTLVAALILAVMALDDEPGAEIYGAANSRDQAGLIFQICKGMIEQNAVLKSKFQTWRNSITYNGRYYKPVAADSHAQHGYNTYFYVYDELHEAKDRDLYDTLSTSTGSRKQPLAIHITTAGYDRNSICYEMHEKTEKVNSGLLELDSFYGKIYTAPMDDDIYDIETLKKANPGYGSIVFEDYLQEQLAKIALQPSFESTFRRLHLNQWVGSEETWISDKEVVGVLTEIPSREELSRMPCYCGLDLAKTRDITAFAKAWVDEKNLIIYAEIDMFCPDETIFERSRNESVPYDIWAKQGYIYTTFGNVIDNTYIFNHIIEQAQDNSIVRIAYDRMFATDLVIDLSEEGLEVMAFGQGFISMNEPTKRLENLIYNKQDNNWQIRIKNNPIIRWMFGNIMIKRDPADNIKIDKGKSKEKVDGIVALVMALGAMPKDMDEFSVYKDKDLLIL